MTISNKSTKATLLAEIARLNEQIELMRADLRTEREVSAAEIARLKMANETLSSAAVKPQPRPSTVGTKPVVLQKLVSVRFGEVVAAHCDVIKQLPNLTERVVKNVRVADIPNLLKGIEKGVQLFNLPDGIEIGD